MEAVLSAKASVGGYWMVTRSCGWQELCGLATPHSCEMTSGCSCKQGDENQEAPESQFCRVCGGLRSLRDLQVL